MFRKINTILLTAALLLSAMSFSGFQAKADPVSLSIDSVVVAIGNETVANLTAGEIPQLEADVTYSLNINYSIPTSLQASSTYLKITLGDGLYFTSLPGATFTPGLINDTSFEELVQAPEGTGTAPYDYPGTDSPKRRSGTVIYRTKSQLTSVNSSSLINFRVDDAFENEDASQVLENAITVAVGTSTDTYEQTLTSNVIAADAYGYSFWNTVSSETIGPEETTSLLASYTSNTESAQSLTKADSQTTVEIVYPKNVTLVSLEETFLYHKNGTIVSTYEEGDNYVSLVSWDEEGGLKGTCNFMPHVKVSSGAMAGGTSFQVILRNFNKTQWNEETGRTSGNYQAVFTVTYLEQGPPADKVGGVTVIDSMPNWSLNQNDTYNVRLGCYTIRNSGTADSPNKTIEIWPDTGSSAIIRGVTIPWTGSFDNYRSVYWEASDGSSGTAGNSVILSPGSYQTDADGNTIYGGTASGALITNTALGLDIDTSITYLKVDIGSIPEGFTIPQGLADLMYNSGASTTTIDHEFYGWSYVSCGVYGAWEKGNSDTIYSKVYLYNTGESSTSGIMRTLTAESSVPEIINGVGTINKVQAVSGDTFTITGYLNNSNWEWNLLQDPVLYIFMPEGFTYSDVSVTNVTSIGDPVEIGTFDYSGETVTVYKYTLDISDTTRGTYQPDFTSKNMQVSLTVSVGPRARIGTYHINDFLGFSTENFSELNAVIKADHWDHFNWDTSKYTDALNASSIGSQVNDGQTMVSLSERTGIAIKQGYEITAKASFSVTDAETSEVTEYVYDDSSEETKEATTAVVERGDTVTLTIDVKNNAKTYLNHCTIFVPLMNSGADFGTGFMPEGENGFKMDLVSTSAPDSFKVQYIKLHEGITYGVNEAPQADDYDIVTDPSEADMVMFISTSTIADGKGGTISLSFRPSETLSSLDNLKRIVITPMLDYDINGNQSTQTKEPAAISYHQPDPTPATADDPPVVKQISGDVPQQSSDFTFTLKAVPSESTLPEDMQSTQMPMPEAAQQAQSMTITIQGEGTSEFGPITFTEEGTYVYEITENNTGVSGYTYDQARYLVTYTVTEENGALDCTRTITKDGESAQEVVFTNKFQTQESSTTDDSSDSQDSSDSEDSHSSQDSSSSEQSSTPDESTPEESKPESRPDSNQNSSKPNTGDSAHTGFYLVILCTACLAIAVLLSARKKRRRSGS